MFESRSVSSHPAFPASKHPRVSLLDAHLQSSVLLAVYLIVGCALAVLSLIGVAYTEQLNGAQALLPYAAMAVMVLWFSLGALVIKKHQRKLDNCHNHYSAYVQRHARPEAERTTVESLTSDEPWELQAFWGKQKHCNPIPRPTAQRHTQPTWSSTHIPSAAQTPRAVPSSTAAWDEAATMHDIEVIATVEGNRTLRPISLFGSVQ